MSFNRLLIFLLILLSPLFSKGADVEMADALVANGKIYIVVCVLAVILAGLFIFLISIDYRLRKLEKKNKP